MNLEAWHGKRVQHPCSDLFSKLSNFVRSIFSLIILSCRFIILGVNSFFIQLFYFISISTLGFLFLKFLKPRSEFKPRDVDLFFTSVSATTVSSMATVEMEAFSNPQLLLITILMFIGGEVFLSMVGLYLSNSIFLRPWENSSLEPPPSDLVHYYPIPEIETSQEIQQVSTTVNIIDNQSESGTNNTITRRQSPNDLAISLDRRHLNNRAIQFLGFVVLGYLSIIHILGISLVLLYISIIPSAEQVLKQKGLNPFTFSVFTIVSTFTSCGYVPTNENMIVFRKNSGLLWILIPQVLFGDTLYPPCLRFSIWFLGKLFKKQEANYLLKNTNGVGYFHLLPGQHSCYLAVTVLGFIMTQFLLFCSMEWDSVALSGLNAYQKIVGVLFQCVNSRHTGETIVDLSTIATAVLVLFVVMMYLPPYTSYLPTNSDEKKWQQPESSKTERGKIAENLIFSQLSYLLIFIILVCITERDKLKEDPLNFNFLNITIEVISAYGNVGFTTGYSCDRQIKPDATCTNKWYGFVGKWSDEGKIILIIVMIFGRLKKFNMEGGKAWKLL